MNNVVGNPEDNSPGVYKINYIPIVQVISIPDAVNGVLTNPILLKEGALWHEIHVTVDANNLELNNSSITEGSVNNITVTGFVAGDAPWIVTTVDEMSDYKEFLVICTDLNGNQRLIGSLEHPALFNFKFTSSGRRGYTLTFVCTSDFAPYYYTTPFVAYPDELLLDPTLLNLDAYLTAFLADITEQLQAYLLKDGSRNLTGFLGIDDGKGFLWKAGADHIKIEGGAAGDLLLFENVSGTRISRSFFGSQSIQFFGTDINEFGTFKYSLGASPSGLSFSNNEWKARLKTDLLTGDREYNMPPTSGTLVTKEELGGLLPLPPNDDQYYAFKNGSWQVITSAPPASAGFDYIFDFPFEGDDEVTEESFPYTLPLTF